MVAPRLLICFAFTILSSSAFAALPKQDPAVPKRPEPPPDIVVPAPKPASGNGGSGSGSETPQEQESDLIEQLSDALERIADGIESALDNQQSATPGTSKVTISTTTKTSLNATSTSCDVTCHFAACALITSIPALYVSATASCPLTTQATLGNIGGLQLGGEVGCNPDWIHEQICRAPLTGNGTSISMTQYVGAAWDAAVVRCASYVNAADPQNDLSLSSYEGFCTSMKYAVSATSWTTATPTATSTSVPAPTQTAQNAAVARILSQAQATALPIVGAVIAIVLR